MPSRSLLHAEKTTLPLNEEQIGLLFAAITRAAHFDRNAKRDYVLIKGSYLLGCRVSEIAVIRWKDIEALDDGGQFTSSVKGLSDALSAYRRQRSTFSRVGPRRCGRFRLPSPGAKDTSRAKQLEMFAANGDVLLDSTSTHTN